MATRGNNAKTLACLLLLVSLVALQQTQQAQAYVCCMLPTNVPLYLACRVFSSIWTCCVETDRWNYLDDNGQCDKPGYVNGDVFGAQADNYHKAAIHYCKLGCTSSMCNKMMPSVFGSSDERKDVIERCTTACHDLCTKDNAKIAKFRDA